MDYNFESLRVEYNGVLKHCLKTKTTQLIQMKEKSLSKTDLDLKAPLDQAFRDVLLEYLDQEQPVSVLKELVEFCMQTCREGYNSPTVPVILLGDIFDALTLDVCQEMFMFVEENVNIWKEELFFSGCKNNLLRLCNNLLRRLSRSTATVFCGRILLFLAKFFPFSERSGLNIVSEFNLENITEYGTDSQDTVKKIDIPDSKKCIVIDYTLYCKFWSLQDFFRSPNQCYNKSQWKLFCSHATAIFNTFQGLKLDYIGKNMSMSNDPQNTMYFSKYLTSQKLLDLQLYDVNFRRFVLLQFLILFQYLISSVKFKSENFELKTEQKEWINTMTTKIYNLLKETPPDGVRFAEIVSNILSREEHWNSWKNEGCPEFRKLQSTSEVTERPHSEAPLLGDLIKHASKEGKYYMGNTELTKLWNLCPDNLEACKGKDRDFLPSLETYFAEAIEQLELQTPVKDEDNLFKNSNFGWRALRLLARRCPHFFMYSSTIMNPLSLYLETMVKRVAHDSPGRTQESTQETQNDADLEENLFKATEEEQNTEEIKQTDGEDFMDDNNQRSENRTITISQLQFFSEKVAPEWKKLALKLGFKKCEVEFFENENPNNPVDQAKHMLRVWLEDDEDATLDNFLYILEGLQMEEAAEAVRSELASAE